MARGQFNTEDELSNYYAKIYAQIENDTLNDPYGNYILQRIKSGQKTVFNKTQSEIRNFDMSFLDTIESVYPAILKIMRDPKKSIRYEEEIVAVEKAKKVNSQTVRHLSSHTHLIKEIKGDDVIPSKVMTTFAEEEIAIYENRFIKSLVKRMEIFLERRYDVMKVSLESFETERLNVSNKFMMSGQEVTVSIDVAIKNDLTTNVETTKEQYNRLLHIRDLVQALKGTEFMRALSKARDVLPPIMKTNIILHNPDFKLCYGLWLYLDRVDGIATNVDIREKSYKYSPIFDKDMNECMALALTSFIKNRNIDGIYASKKLPQVKAPKPEENQELIFEPNLEADNKKLEDYQMNELLLSQTAKFFEASMDGMQRTGNNYSESIRVVYRQMLDMLDQIYPMAFGIPDDELESKDLYEQLEYARRRMMVFKIVRQAKQMNIARMGKEEKNIEKLMKKLEEKIKVQEQKERERAERDRLREEEERLAALEKKRAETELKKRLEKEALQLHKNIEKRKLEDKTAKFDEAKLKEQTRMLKAIESARNYLRDLKAQEEAEEAKALMPVRRKDEFDDLSDDELKALLDQNEILTDEAPEVEAAPEEVAPQEEKAEAPKKKKVKKPAEPKAEESKPAKKSTAEKDIEEFDDSELEALLAANGMFGDSGFNFSSADLAADDEEEAPQEVIEKPKATKPAKKEKKNDAAIKTTKTREEEAPANEITVDLSDKDLEELSDEELEALMLANMLDDEIPESNTPSTTNKPTNNASASAVEPEPEVESDSSDDLDDFEDISDDDLDALLKENGLI